MLFNYIFSVEKNIEQKYLKKLKLHNVAIKNVKMIGQIPKVTNLFFRTKGREK